LEKKLNLKRNKFRRIQYLVQKSKYFSKCIFDSVNLPETALIYKNQWGFYIF
jgi:hypothetical protein